jgi:hypothetical protein
MSCSTRSCHGGGEKPPILSARSDPSALRAALVGIRAEERSDLVYVHPGDPLGSYVMNKVDGRLHDRACSEVDCGDPMPLDNPPLQEDARQVIRTWIAQGARDN